MEQQGCSLGEPPRVDVGVIAPDPSLRVQAMGLLASLRKAGIAASMDYAGKTMKSQLKAASQEGIRGVCILGGDEVAQGVGGVKNLRTGEQENVPLQEIPSYLAKMLRE
jgi:histidyl-tRNA synthetase